MAASKPEGNVLIMAPVGQDGASMAALLTRHGISSIICESAPEACRQVTPEALALLLTEEALELPKIAPLLESLKAQPAWSELPVIILTSGGESRLAKLLDLVAEAARTITLLERPIGQGTFLRSVEVALRSRSRQYEVRDLLQELADAKRQLEEHAQSLERIVGERTRDLVTTNEQLEEFVYSIAHDLRAPLRTMGGYSQLLLEDYAAGLDPMAQHLLKRIESSSAFMDKLILDLLAYGRAARADIELMPVHVRQAWQNAVFQCGPQIEQSKALIDTVEPLPVVLAHEPTFGQCLVNLLSNALKFIAPNVRPHVRCYAEDRQEFARIWIEDNGIGIPATQHERVFRVFERLNGTRYAGTGIGLSIVRKGIERMGGRVGIESEPGKGSRFWIELRRAN